MGSLDHKVAVVTGASRGIGEATARLLAEAGARVAICARNGKELEAVRAALGADRVLAVAADVSDEAQVARLFAETRKAFGGVDILVNNAGIIRSAPIDELKATDWDEVLEVNLRGSFLCAREAFRFMKERGQGGTIVNVSSLAGIRGVEKFPGGAAYVASKHGVIGLTEILAVEGRAHKIRANAVAPGAIDTRLLREGAPFLKTSAKPEDVARSILFLADDSQSAHVTGAVVEMHTNE
ncbi:MAG TPA: SDR family NAD(P)-dependent oxidoreductase [bacterium]|nr:SDR family NAD(P)-dependent oxidoreductase [bacterium]